ncbi:MAG TPA: tRNA (adenosine(37)-N6)-threonylcarbamoyltransferase complex ATPase subunit type 1 TsaE [Puia sp.]|jgi:tRNA threonylcarbamoyladenosine biosynthesis protein TsaE|nr:tRNA (adenosine(37)-N6)-threonylcarbamoyltransferase complex ATPase subunit type 1 TsaE [Puia sp.]
MEWTYKLSDIDEMARIFWESITNKKIFAFQGAMGVGKTSFIRALCSFKKVRETVSSPTFSIINEYGYPAGIIYHLDLYRLKNEEEAIKAGVEDCLTSGEICLVEWPDRAPGIFPKESLAISIELLDDKTRKITLLPHIGKNSG